MKNFNPTSLENSRSNIVPFQSAVRSKFSYTSQRGSVWERFWDKLFDLLMSSTQPVVTQKPGQEGGYQVYDPITQRSQTFASELETLIWLERRFYDNSRNL
ncbi:MAG: hypothetical protein KME07_03880 [Pegethrix bostrychoides GSE-TBD4-15B]|jgi:hypothetical protein|uniref:Uncharacterized protein n=1 Tax=Pegethrix bostrychoides GSE-TBD4-15B TaxID=2839662 RepID=A0A951U4L3_9CYAN|nr:hypothetical protein [Pegethrix bostrychoides GSE-TBD4-15B]